MTERNTMTESPRRALLIQCITALLEKYGFQIASDEGARKYGFVVLAERNGKQYAIASKAYTYSSKMSVSDAAVFAAAKELAEIAPGRTPVLVMAGVVSAECRRRLAESFSGLILLDIQNLLYMVQFAKGLYDDLVASLPYAVDALTPMEPEFFSLRITGNPGIGKSRGLGARDWGTSGWAEDYDPKLPGMGKTVAFERKVRSNADLRGELENWQGGRGVSASGDYEKLCVRVLKRLFAEDLTIWQDQAKSNAGLYRFDLICKIKRDNRKDFWEVAERHFGSKYIIFEFKNYKDLVTQKEVFTTVRYLYTKALRGVAIILSPNGIDENAGIAIRGVLRDEGKLILTLTNAELIGMLQMQEKGEDPADYLSCKLDELLIDLEK